MKHSFLLIIFLCAAITPGNTPKEFNSRWYDGNAEISTYSLTESRYGEMREGQRVMVIVTEPRKRTDQMAVSSHRNGSLTGPSTVTKISISVKISLCRNS